MKFKNVNLFDTGGHTYVYTAKTENGNWIAFSDYSDISVFDEEPTIDIICGDDFYEWSKEHTLEIIREKKALDLSKEVLLRVLSDQQLADGFYTALLEDISVIEEEKLKYGVNRVEINLSGKDREYPNIITFMTCDDERVDKYTGTKDGVISCIRSFIPSMNSGTEFAFSYEVKSDYPANATCVMTYADIVRMRYSPVNGFSPSDKELPKPLTSIIRSIYEIFSNADDNAKKCFADIILMLIRKDTAKEKGAVL